MQTRVDSAVVEMAARILQEDPSISNHQMLQRLAQHFGRGLALEIPITRMERMVRDPALLLLRRSGPGNPLAAAKETPPAPVAPVPSPEARAKESPPPRRTPRKKRARRTAPKLERSIAPSVLESALLEAFQLGAEAESRSDLVEAYAALRRLQDRIERTLAEPAPTRQNRSAPPSE